jgi:hypothetical protein
MARFGFMGFEKADTFEARPEGHLLDSHAIMSASAASSARCRATKPCCGG